MVTLVINDGRQIFQKIPDSLEKLVDYLEENKARWQEHSRLGVCFGAQIKPQPKEFQLGDILWGLISENKTGRCSDNCNLG